MPLVEGVDENWDERTTGNQIMRPDWDFSPIRMRTMHHLPHIFFDTLRPERPDCPVLVPSSFSRSRDRIINMDIYSYEPCRLPTGNFMPAEKSQIRLMTASPITLRACIPAPDQVTPQQVYFKDLDFYKQTLFHTPFLSRGRAVTLLEYRDAKIVFEVDDWFNLLPQGVPSSLIIRDPWMTRGLIKSSKTINKLHKRRLGKSKTDALHDKFITFRNVYNKLKRQQNKSTTKIYFKNTSMISKKHGVS